jgi:hypothetical protein
VSEYGARDADLLEGRLTDDDRALLDDCADWLHGRALTSAALFFFEAMKPLNFVTSAWMIMIRPYLSVLRERSVERFDRARTLLEERGAIELLLRRLEARA